MSPMSKTIKIEVNKTIVTLDDNKDYKASGGQAVIYVKADTAYKIYHDPADMIPEAKILELNKLNKKNILSPKAVIYNLSKDPIGFTMDYIDGTEFLCQIFTKTFRQDRGVTNQQIVDLVKMMQESLEYIHSTHILVVDYNEMNFLLSKTFDTVFHIDVDSWQTPKFKAPVIMESIRDRTSKTYTELTDWFSWAVVSFQMYIGIHPYKGVHPKFKPAEWSKRMDQGISVFDKAVTLPDTCQPLSSIPKKHLEWYKAVFMKNERSIPPYADDIVVTAAITQIIGSKGDFIIKLEYEVKEPIKGIFHFHYDGYLVSTKHIYDDHGCIYDYKGVTVGMCDCFNESPVVAEFSGSKIEFYSLKHDLLDTMEAEDMMGYNGFIYSINNRKLIQNSFERFGKIIHGTKEVCNLGSSYKVFRGVIVQDIFRTCWLAIPFEKDACINIHVDQLDGHRIIDARYDRGFCIIISEFKGKYIKSTMVFAKDHTGHVLKQEEINGFYPVNFTVLSNGLCIAIDDEKLSIFNAKGGKEIRSNLPFDVSMRLFNDGSRVLFVDGNKLYSVTMK